MKKRNKQIICFSGLLVILLVALLIILNIDSNAKKESNNTMKKFDEYVESSSKKVIFYYDSLDSKDVTSKHELEYLIQISKDYDIEYLKIDKSNLNKKNRKKIEKTLGINDTTSALAVVSNKQVNAISIEFKESNRLVEFFIEAKLLDEGSKYKPVSEIIFIDYSEYKELIKKKKENIVVIGQAGCEYCTAAKKILNNISKAYDIKIYYIDVKELNKNDYNELFEELLNKGFNDSSLVNDDYFYMPTLIVFKKDKVEKYLSGTKTLEEYKSFLKENDLID